MLEKYLHETLNSVILPSEKLVLEVIGMYIHNLILQPGHKIDITNILDQTYSR